MGRNTPETTRSLYRTNRVVEKFMRKIAALHQHYDVMRFSRPCIKKAPLLLPALRGLFYSDWNRVIRNLRLSASICTVVHFAGKHVAHEYAFPTATAGSSAIHPCPGLHR